MLPILLIVYDQECQSFLRRIIESDHSDFSTVSRCHDVNLGLEQDESIVAFVKRLRGRSAGMKAMIYPFYCIESYRGICMAI